MRFLENCRSPKEERNTSNSLSPEEILTSENYLVRVAQYEEFTTEFKALQAKKPIPQMSKLLALNPVLDESEIIRSQSRLQYAASVAWETATPIILPKQHHITELIIRDVHEQSHHTGVNHTLNILSKKYWIISSREVIKSVIQKCIVCKKRKAKTGQQIMSPLPQYRTGKSMKAFNLSSVDYAGPFLTKQGRGKSRAKRYLCLFTCMEIRAVHLEISFNLDTDSFLNAFFRFVSRRGLPSEMWSDNGTNFVGGVNELAELGVFDKDKIVDSTSHLHIKWHFNPPGAPHFNGVHESLVKSAKRAIYSILGNADINDEELLSAITGAEALLNSRPLTYLSLIHI